MVCVRVNVGLGSVLIWAGVEITNEDIIKNLYDKDTEYSCIILVRPNLSKFFTWVKFKRIISYDLSTFVILYTIISTMREIEINSDVLPQVRDPWIEAWTKTRGNSEK